MMTKTSLFLLLLMVTHLSYAQNMHWAKVTPGQTSSVTGCQIFSAEVFDDVLYTCGTFYGPTNIGVGWNSHIVENSFQPTYGGLFISKANLDGIVLESIVFDELVGEFGLSSMTLDSMGNILLVATCWGQVDTDPYSSSGTMGAMSSNSRFALYMKLDSNFNIIWKRSLGVISGSPTSTEFETNQVVTDAAGSMYVIGHYLTAAPSLDFDPGAGVFELNTPSNYRSPYILKLDSSGSFEWAYHLNDYSVTTGFDLAVDSDGMVYSTGYISSNVDFDNSIDTSYLPSYLSGWRGYLMKLDSIGQFEWVLGSASTGNSFGYSVATTGDDKVVYGGEYYHDCYFFGTNGDTLNLPTSPQGYTASFLVEYDALGNLVFANSYGKGQINLVKVHMDTILFSGFMSDTVQVETSSGPASIVCEYASGPHVLKLNSAGQYLDHLQIQTTEGSAHVQSIIIDDAGYIYLSGKYDENIFFTSTSQDLSFNAATLYEGFQTKYDFAQNYSSLNESDLNTIVVYPNPTQSEVTFSINDHEKHALKLISSLGITIHETELVNGTVVQMGDLPAGLYYFRIDEQHVVKVMKH